MVNSLLDTDFYKLSMQQLFFKQFPNVNAEYKFVCRNKSIDLSPIITKLKAEVLRISNITYTPEEILYLKNLAVFDENFITFLSSFKLDPNHVKISNQNNQLSIRIKGPITQSSPWEIYLLSTINELFFKINYPELDLIQGKDILNKKIEILNNHPSLKIMEFGTRRRLSSAWQEEVLLKLKETSNLIGTSNVFLAMKHNLTPLGTQAHELYSAYQVMAPNLLHFQNTTLNKWKETYNNKFQIALTDIISTDSFLKDFNEELSKSYKGVRHDSGDPIIWGEKILNHYRKFGINPQDKTLIFSDGLDIPRSVNIFNHFKDKTNLIFGIGTNLTNDVGVPALNIVIKMVSCNGLPVAKISDEPSKAICEDPIFLQKVKTTFGVF